MLPTPSLLIFSLQRGTLQRRGQPSSDKRTNMSHVMGATTSSTWVILSSSVLLLHSSIASNLKPCASSVLFTSRFTVTWFHSYRTGDDFGASESSGTNLRIYLRAIYNRTQTWYRSLILLLDQMQRHGNALHSPGVMCQPTDFIHSVSANHCTWTTSNCHWSVDKWPVLAPAMHIQLQVGDPGWGCTLLLESHSWQGIRIRNPVAEEQFHCNLWIEETVDEHHLLRDNWRFIPCNQRHELEVSLRTMQVVLDLEERNLHVL